MPIYDITEGLPFSLGGGAGTTASTWTNSNIVFDVALGGLPFLLAISDETPYDRYTMDSERPQYDASKNPGEQTLSAWWLRSQTSFHLGAGQDFFEPADDEVTQHRFDDSYGVDVFTEPGKVTLLPATTNVETYTGRTLVLGYDDSGTGKFLVANGTAVKRNTGLASAAATWGGAGTVLSMVDDGTSAYIADSTGIYKMALAAGAGALAWNTGSSPVALGFVKQRLVAGIGPSVYELVGGAPPTLPTALYTHPNASWTWVGFAEGPNCIYAAGYAGSKGAVFKFALDTDGTMPTLGAGSVVAELPTGETVRSIFSYLGAYVALGTNKGVRVAVTTSDGDLQYGPLSVETTNAVLAFTGRDRYIYAGVQDGLNGDSGLVCIDLGGEVAPLRFAYSNHLVGGSSGTVDSVTLMGNTGLLVMGNQNAYLESSTTNMTTGYLKTSAIRFGTLEPKLFKKVNIRASADSDEAIAVSQIDQYESESSVGSFGGTSDQFDDFSLIDVDDQVSMAFRFTLTRGATIGNTPVLNGYQAKALNSAYPGEVLRVPVKVFDFDKDSNAAKFGYAGYGYAKFQALKSLEESGNAYQFQDLRIDETLTVTIKRVRLIQNSPRHGTSSGFGGVASIEMRTL